MSAAANGCASDDAVARLIWLHGGELIGRTRLQKDAYFLERCGLGWGFEFEYYNYGPYSADLAYAADLGVRRHKLWAEERPGTHGTPYTIFRVDSDTGRPAVDDRDPQRREVLSLLRDAKLVPLELAATFDFIACRRARGPGSRPSADMIWQEVARLKPTKTTPENIVAAQRLLGAMQPLLLS